MNDTTKNILNGESLVSPNKKVKDSVFTSLFSEPCYSLQGYHALHPEDTTVTLEDICNITTQNNIKSLLKINVDPATIMQAFNISEAELEAMRQEMLTE